jgi:hypothetical protein
MSVTDRACARSAPATGVADLERSAKIMSLVESLLDNADSDRDLLRKNEAIGDIASIPRDLDFVLYAKNQKKAELVCSFVHDNSYGRSFYQAVPENPARSQHRIIVQVFMPTTEHAVCAVSGLMVCLAKLYDLEYDGWGCSIKDKRPNKAPEPTTPSVTPAADAPVAPAGVAAHL